MTTYQQWFGRFAVGASNDSFSVDATAKTLTAGNYYITGYTAESASQLCEHMTTLVAAVVASSTVAYNATTGFIKITFGSGSHKITFTDTALKTLLGFGAVDTTTTAAASFTATREPQYVWRPNRGTSSHPVQLNQFWAPRSTTIVGRSKDGTTYGVRGNLLYDAEVSYTMLEESRVIVPSTGSVNKELQTFYEDVVHAGQPIRIYPDRTLAASTSYVTALVSPGKEDEAVPAWGDFATRHVANYNGLWDVTLPLVKWVE
jgi:hypothetical protein